jgi:hypothetical protein
MQIRHLQKCNPGTRRPTATADVIARYAGVLVQPAASPRRSRAVVIDGCERARDVGRWLREVVAVPAVVTAGRAQRPSARRSSYRSCATFVLDHSEPNAGFHGGRRSTIVMLARRMLCSIR